MIKVTIVLIAGLGAAALLRRRSAALRHWVLAASVLLAAAVPALQAVAPAWRLPALASQAVAMPRPLALTDSAGEVQPAAVPPVRPSPTPMASLLRWSGLAWAAGVAVNLAILLSAFAWLTAQARRARPVEGGTWESVARNVASRFGMARPVRLLLTDHPALLVTWGLWRPTVLLPRGAADWPQDRIRVVLGHELAHVRRADWLAQVLAECLKSVYWFNPIAWVACRRLRHESERACDDEVLRLGVEAPEYAGQLLDLARAFTERRRSLLPVPAMAQSSELERRVRAMLNTRLDRARVGRHAFLLVPVALLALVVPLAGLTLSEEPAVTAVAAPGLAPPPLAQSPEPAAVRATPTPGPTRLAAATTSPSPSATPAPRPASSPAPAAQATATVKGTVTDQMGRTVPDVRVTIVVPPTKAEAVVVTDDAGQFAFSGPAGEYAVSASRPGFKKVLLHLELPPGQVSEQRLQLELGSLAETVVVAADRNAVQALPELPDDTAPARPAARPLPDDPCSESKAGGCVAPPQKIRDAKPRYPINQLRAGVSGVAVIEGTVLADGTVGDLQPAPDTDPDFAAAAMKAIKRWAFVPTRLDGTPVETHMKVTVQFYVNR